MIDLVLSPASDSVVAVTTTVHLAVLLLRIHRNPAGRRYDLLLLPSVVFAVTPWLFFTVGGLAVGLAAHFGWFLACARFVPVPATLQTASTAPSSRPRVSAPQTRPAPKAAAIATVSVVAVIRETEDIMTFRITRPDGFDFCAGQFLTVRVTLNGKPVSRCYSISSPPEATGYLEISVKRQGRVSGMLHATVRPGSLLEVLRPAGPFVYPADDQRPLTLLAGGVGITPLMSMLRHAVQADPTRPVTLLYSVHTHRDVAFRDELTWFARRHPQLRIVVTTTRGPHSTTDRSGRIDRELVMAEVTNLDQNIFMICGPGPMIDAMRSLLADLGVPPDQVRAEAFEAAVASTAAHDDGEVPEVASMDAAASGGFQLKLVTSGQTIIADGGQTLLETCETAGIDIPSACRAGVCGTCRCRLVDGQVRSDSDLLDASDQADGYILPCVSWPTSDCAMEA